MNIGLSALSVQLSIERFRAGKGLGLKASQCNYTRIVKLGKSCTRQSTIYTRSPSH
jgi:hypothetical protein